MSTANTITVSCLLDDGTGTYPIDVSSQVSLSAGIDLSGYGRADESTSATAAQLTFTLKNNDGSFTTGVPGGFGGGGFGGGFFGGVVTLVKGRLLKFGLTVGGTPRTYFTGRIDSFSQSFTGAPGKRSDITITALDALTDYARRPLRSMVEQEIVTRSPTLYYTLGESEGSTSAGDTSGRGGPSLATTGAVPALTFGTGTGPTDGLPAVTFAGGQYLSVAPPTPLLMTGSWSVVAFFSTTQVVSGGTVANIVSIPFNDNTGGLVGIGMNIAGRVVYDGIPGGGSGGGQSTNVVNDGRIHCAVLTFDGTNVRRYTDGVLDGTNAGLPGLNAPLRLEIGGAFSYANGVKFTGVISHVAIYDGAVLSGAQITSIAGALTGFGETTDARLTRLAAYAGATGITTNPSGQLMSGQPTSGQSLLDAISAVADAEGGVVYIDGLGQLRMQGRYYRALKTAASLSLSGKAVDPGSFDVVDDTNQAMNSMTVTRTDGATQTWPLITPTTNLYPGSLELAVDTDANALARAQWEVAKHSTPGPRLPSLTTTDLRTSASATSLHARDLGDRIHFTGLPTTTNPTLSDVTIEGWSMHLDRDTWTFTYNLLPWSLAQVFTLDDATYGVLDSTTPIGY